MKKSLEKRIENLEKKFSPKSPGTILSRVSLDQRTHGYSGYGWCLAIGKLSMPKDFYYGRTIEEVFSNAENEVNREFSWSDLNQNTF